MRWADRGVALALLLAGCTLVTTPVDEAPPDVPGPDGQTLVLQVVNRAERDLEVTWEFSAPDMTGEGSGPIPGCESGAISLGTVAGEYRLFIDGEDVHAGTAPSRDDGYLVLGISVAPDGSAAVNRPQAWTMLEPVFRTVPLGGCG